MAELPARRYNEKEVARLLKRASELQRSSPAAPNPSGLTLTELEDIAREAGLDAEHAGFVGDCQPEVVDLDGDGAHVRGSKCRRGR